MNFELDRFWKNVISIYQEYYLSALQNTTLFLLRSKFVSQTNSFDTY